MSRSMVVVKGTKKGQLEALLEQCVQLNADVRPNIEQGYFTVTVPPPWNISAQLVAQAVELSLSSSPLTAGKQRRHISHDKA